MRRGATIALVTYTVLVLLAAVYWSPLAAAIIGTIGLGILTAWSCCVVGAAADDVMERHARRQW